MSPPPSIRRSYSVPASVRNGLGSSSSRANAQTTGDGVETLFTSNFAKVVSFSAGSGTRPSSSSSNSSSLSQLKDDAPGTLSWKTPTERTIAAGPLRIYRVPGSVAFLHSGTLLHAILPKSQCWCVDGESTFVLRIRMNNYYRIELPTGDEDQKQKIEEFKVALNNVLHYEKTPCPFSRGFEVELPETPETPVRRRPWKPPERAKRWKLDRIWEPEDKVKKTEDAVEVSKAPAKTPVLDEEDSASVLANPWTDERSLTSPQPAVDSETQDSPKIPTRSRVLLAARTFSTPNQFSLRRGPFSPFSSTSELNSPRRGTPSRQSSMDSFYSFSDSTRTGTSSPAYLDASSRNESAIFEEDEELGYKGIGRLRRKFSDLTVSPAAPSTVHGSECGGRRGSEPSTPTLMSDRDDSSDPAWSEVNTPQDAIRLHRLTGTSPKRLLSPLPRPTNLFGRPVKSRSKSFTSDIVHKTATLLLGPPAHLVSLMLRIAQWIGQGKFTMTSFNLGLRNADEKVPGSWDSSDEGELGESEYGIPLHRLDESTMRGRGRSADWDVD